MQGSKFAITCAEQVTSAFEQRPQSSLVMAISKAFQEAAYSLLQAYDPAVLLERSSADAELNRPEGRSVHRPL